jgi:hypothetical protein
MQSKSGNGRGAGLKWEIKRAEMRKRSANGDVLKPHRLRQLKKRRRGEQEVVGHRHDGADRAIGDVAVSIVVGRLLKGLGQPGEKSGRGTSDFPVEMPERQRKLDRERQQRQPRAVLEVFPEPVHELRLPRTTKRLSRPML